LKVEFRGSFVKDLRRIRDRSLKKRVQEVIELVERADTLQEIGGVRKLRGGDQYYRVRIGDYRLGLILDEDTVILVRFLHRKDVYRYFP
jgi:mRNA interferase RelE/StbE